MLEGLNSKEAEAHQVLQEIQLGRRECNQEQHELGTTHKRKTYASQRAELSLICQDNTRLWLWPEACLLPIARRCAIAYKKFSLSVLQQNMMTTVTK